MRLAAAAALAVTVIAAAPAAHAQAPGETAPMAPLPPPPAPAPEDAKNGTTAVLLSLGGTAAGFGLMALAGDQRDPDTATTLGLTGFAVFTLGPSFGRWYAGHAFWTTGLSLRTGGVAAAMLGAIIAFNTCGIDTGTCNNNGDNIGSALLIGGALLFVGGGIYDIAVAPGEVTDWNRAHARSLSIAPTALRDARGDTAPGLALVGSF
jgi:hypothetical protein